MLADSPEVLEIRSLVEVKRVIPEHWELETVTVISLHVVYPD